MSAQLADMLRSQSHPSSWAALDSDLAVVRTDAESIERYWALVEDES